MLLPKVCRLASVRRFTDDNHVCFPADERNEPFTDHAMVIIDQHLDPRFLLCRFFRARRSFAIDLFLCAHIIAASSQGKTTVMFVPLPFRLLMLSAPPICSTRSRIPVRPMPSWPSLIWNPSPSSR